MRTSKLILAATVSVLALTGSAWAASDKGSADEAKAMLEKAVAAVKADKAKALEMFTKGEGGFKDRDLYPFCGGADGKFSAHPKLVGQSLKDLKDKAGKAFGEEIYKVAAESTITAVDYMWPLPSGGDPVQKSSQVTKVGDQVCAVGYYK